MAKRNCSYPEGVNELIGICRVHKEHRDWNDINNLNHQKIINDFEKVFRGLVKQIQENNINGLYFGFTEVSLDGGLKNSTYMVETAGTGRCNPNDRDCEWIFSCEWRPGFMFGSDELTTMRKIIRREGGLFNDAEYPIGLAVTILTINELTRKYEKKLKHKQVAIAAGFHDGDIMRIKGFNE